MSILLLLNMQEKKKYWMENINRPQYEDKKIIDFKSSIFFLESAQ